MVGAGPAPMGVTPGENYTAVIEVAQDADGSFRWTNLNIAAGKDLGRGIFKPAPFPSLTGGLAAIGWGSDSRRVFYANTDGAVIELAGEAEGWAYRNLTGEIGAPAAAWNSPLAGLNPPMVLYYVDEDRRLVTLEHKPVWKVTVSPKSVPDVPESSALTALHTDRGSFAYFFKDNQHVMEVEGTGVQVTDLTNYAQLPAASPLSALAATGWGPDRRRVYYASTDDELIQAAGFGGGGNGWSWENLSKVGARALIDGSPLAAANNGSALGIALCDRESKPLWQSSDSGWQTQEIYSTGKKTRPVAAANSSIACAIQNNVTAWVAFVTEDNHLALWKGPQDYWRWWDLSADLKLPAPATMAAQGPLALLHTENGPRVYYLTDGLEF